MMNKKSFTLVEILITVLITTIVLSAVLALFVNDLALGQQNKEFSIAMNIARAKMEELINKRSDFVNIVSTPEPGIALSAATDGIAGLYRIDVTDISYGSNPVVTGWLKQIKISVCWKSLGNRIIGQCKNNAGLPNGPLDQWYGAKSSPCSIETALSSM